MAEQLTSVACGDDYTVAATIRDVYNPGGGAYIVINNSVFYRLQHGGLGADYWTPEAPLSPGGGPIPADATGVQFRNAAVGKTATVSALIRPRSQPFLTQTFVSAPASTLLTGAVSSAGATVAGSGFTPARTGVGVYTVTFATPFAARPVVVLTPESSALPAFELTSVTVNGFGVSIWSSNTAGTPLDCGFGFLAQAVT